MNIAPTEELGVKRSRVATRARLLVTSSEVFAEKGIEGASVEELCSAAGFSRGAFYSNFASKMELALAIYEDHVGQLINGIHQQLDTWLGTGESSGAVAQHVIEGMSDFTTDITWHSMRLELLLAARRSAHVRKVVLEQRSLLAAAVSEALLRVAESERLAFTIGASHLAGLLLSAYDGQLNNQLSSSASNSSQPSVLPALWLAFTEPGEDVPGDGVATIRGAGT